MMNIFPIPFTPLIAELRLALANPKIKQTERVIPDWEGASLIVYPSGTVSVVLRFVDPLTGNDNCKVLGNIEEGLPSIVTRYAEAKAMLNAGISPNRSTIKVSEYVCEILKLNRRDLSRFKNHIEPSVGQIKLTSITPRMLEKLLSELPSHLSDSTKRNVAACLKKVFRHAVDDGYLSVSPAKSIKLVSVDNYRERTLQPHEIQSFRNAIAVEPNRRAALCYELSLQTGARMGNVLAARFDEFQLELRQWCISGTKMKNGHSAVIPLSDGTLEVVRELRTLTDGPWLFPGQKPDTHMSPPTKVFKRICARAGISGLRPHDLRRSFATLALEAGVPLPEIAKLLSHRSMASINRYAVVREKRLLAAAQLVSAAINAASNQNQVKEAA